MSFRDRDKSNLKDYLRNNSGSKLIDEIKKDFENNRKAWFDSPLRRDGFPFKNDDVFGKKSDPGIKSHLEDLAKKHPEFAGDLQRPLWEDPQSTNWDNAFTVPVSVEKPSADHDRPGSSQSKPSETEVDGQPAAPESSNGQPSAASQETMNDHQQDAKEPKRFTSKIEITPVNPFEEAAGAGAGAAEQGRQSQPGTPNSARKQPQVRHIPIFVEGRSEPVVPKNTAGNFQSTNQFPPQQQQQQYEQQIPIKRKFENSTEHSGPAKQEERTQQQIPIPVHMERTQQQIPVHVERNQTPIPVHVEKTKPGGKPAAEKHEPEPPKPAEKPPQQVQKLDPMARISQVQQEVDELAAQVEKFTGTSRTEKAYLYLDEMLTRNLIKLDTVEVEGNEKLRLARKDVIKSIQKAISLLESKVPLPTPTEQPDQQEEEANQNESSSNVDEPMEGDDQSRQQNDPQNQNNDGGGQPK